MTGLIVLAAGASSRLGTPKQNLNYQGNTLLQRAIETAQSSVCRPIIVVLGANSALIKPTIENKPITVIQNDDWREGMASSIRTGIKGIQNSELNVSSVILMLCDQPFVDAAILNALAKSNADNYGGIAGCAYNDTIGPPVIFDKAYFDELSLLKGQEGAKKLLFKYIGKVVAIPFPLGKIDIDTVEDYERISRG